MTIRVVVADDHPLMRGGLAAVIATAPDLALVGEARDGREAVTQFRALCPDVLLIDLAMPELGGIDAIRIIMGDHARATARSADAGGAPAEPRAAPRVVVLTVYAGDEDIHRALAAGALGYLFKDSGGAQVVAAIRAAARGERIVAPDVAARLTGSGPRADLSARELEVLTLVARGYRNREIATTIGRTEETVKMHVKSVLSKLGARDRTAAVAVALERGLLHIPP
jgi:DNA-binding NarL/FixJ family response regulator